MVEQYLKPVTSVACPKTGSITTAAYCSEICHHFIEERRPWRYWRIKCDPEVKHR